MCTQMDSTKLSLDFALQSNRQLQVKINATDRERHDFEVYHSGSVQLAQPQEDTVKRAVPSSIFMQPFCLDLQIFLTFISRVTLWMSVTTWSKLICNSPLTTLNFLVVKKIEQVHFKLLSALTREVMKKTKQVLKRCHRLPKG